MPNIQRQVTPYIGLRRRDLSACRNPKLEKLLDTATTPLQRYQQTPTRDLAPILSRAVEIAPTLPPGRWGFAVGMVLGFGLNDSGIAIPAVGIMLAFPLVMSPSVFFHTGRPVSASTATVWQSSVLMKTLPSKYAAPRAT